LIFCWESFFRNSILDIYFCPFFENPKYFA